MPVAASSSAVSGASGATSINPVILIGSALAFVAGIAWNDAIQTGLEEYGPTEKGSQFKAKLIYAVIITIIVSGIVYALEFVKTTVS